MTLQHLVDTYTLPSHAHELFAQYPPLAIAGPTGVGKGTISQYLTQMGGYAPIVSDTTRAPRPLGNGLEVNGVHYWFIDEATAHKKLEEGMYVEAKLVHGDTLYGTSISAYEAVATSGRTPIIEIDVQGIEDLMKLDDSFEAVMLLPPSFEVWNERLDGRGDMTHEQKVRRFGTAVFEYGKLFENDRFHPVVNIEVVETAKVIQSGEYLEEEYRRRALTLTAELLEATKTFLATHE